MIVLGIALCIFLVFIAWLMICCGVLEYWGIYSFSKFVKWMENIFPPHVMYENTNMNKAGCLICTVLLAFLIFPLTIVYLVYVLFHIGRKDEKK